MKQVSLSLAILALASFTTLGLSQSVSAHPQHRNSSCQACLDKNCLCSIFPGEDCWSCGALSATSSSFDRHEYLHFHEGFKNWLQANNLTGVTDPSAWQHLWNFYLYQHKKK